MDIRIVSLGKIDYKSALDIQETLHKQVIEGTCPDTFLILEHNPVLTLGVRGGYSNLLIPKKDLKNMGIDIYKTTRGGDVTYHGPGQIVGYPIMNLKNYEKSIKQYVYKIEDVFIRLLENEFGISAYREEKKYTGVWVGMDKITAIGVSFKRWVTMHGFSFNVNTNLDHFKWINPCGITDKGVTSLSKLTNKELDMTTINDMVIHYFCEVFSANPVYITKKEL